MLSILGGVAFVPALMMLCGAVVMGMITENRIARVLARVLALGGLIALWLSATPLGGAFYWLLILMTFAWALIGEWMILPRWARASLRSAIVLWCIAAYAIDYPYRRSPAMPPAPVSRLTIIGDSISAGVGTAGVETWPRIFAQKHPQVQVIDLSRAGATLSSALQGLRGRKLGDGIVLLEIGGNDLLRGASADTFAADLEALLKSVCGDGRIVVMLELPTPPWNLDLDRVQRRLAKAYGVKLIPKRHFAQILAGETLDGLHLAESGHQAMEQMVWQMLEPSLTGAPPAPPLPR
jgi:lysophospholipase L1-like esterase